MRSKSALSPANRYEELAGPRDEQGSDPAHLLQALFITAGWTPIAWRPRATDPGSLLTWTPYLDAPIDVSAAHRLQVAGRILMANRHNADRVELVIRRAV